LARLRAEIEEVQLNERMANRHNACIDQGKGGVLSAVINRGSVLQWKGHGREASA